METKTFEFVTDAMHVAKRQAAQYSASVNGITKFMVLATTDDYRTTKFEVSMFSHDRRNAAVASGRRLVEIV